MTIAFEALVIWLAIVLASMLAVAYLSRRWGHDPFGWLLLAAVMGPIAIIALVGTRRKDEEASRREAASVRHDGLAPVIVACDGSEASGRAARYAATANPVSRVILFVVEGHEAEPRSPQDVDQQRERVAVMIAPAQAALKEQGVGSETVIRYGNPGEEIVRYADAASASAIVVGRKGAGLSRALLGSVSDHVVRNANRPVLVVS